MSIGPGRSRIACTRARRDASTSLRSWSLTSTYATAEATTTTTATATAEASVSRARKLMPRNRPHPPASRSRTLRLPQRVPDTADRLDQPRLAACLGLAAQVADVDVERIRGRPEVVAPDPLEDQGAGEHLPRVAEEELEQVELRPRELDG